GYLWYKCTGGNWVLDQGRNLLYNSQEDSFCDSSSAVVSSYSIPGGHGFRSLIPKYDTSSVNLTNGPTTPSPRPKENLAWGLEIVNNTDGVGAFKDVTYNVRVNTQGGVVPSNVK
ncbi:1441_t:CDS:2, partial [Scutellospora calospora]